MRVSHGKEVLGVVGVAFQLIIGSQMQCTSNVDHEVEPEALW